MGFPVAWILGCPGAWEFLISGNGVPQELGSGGPWSLGLGVLGSGNPWSLGLGDLRGAEIWESLEPRVGDLWGLGLGMLGAGI